uniref:NADH-ubiquinone oxidoreductase chain 3 n=1 Tax=Munidopsis lauensis TaxID=418534 RepID=A0A5J6UQS7_9EUCA|nr:NADH dehydrogenase subunit 3 [Munidopsis lauensis]
MFLLLTLTSLTFIIVVLIMTIASLVSKKTTFDREKSSPYECGFDPKELARIPFSLQFFLIAVIFLIFDVEITLILPLAYITQLSNIFSWLFTGASFIFILLFGLYFEWKQGALEWSN